MTTLASAAFAVALFVAFLTGVAAANAFRLTSLGHALRFVFLGEDLEDDRDPDVLSPDELTRLAELGREIRGSLSCDVNGEGVPCRTDRFEAVEAMAEYLEVHGWFVEEPRETPLVREEGV